MTTPARELHATLDKRLRPEEVASLAGRALEGSLDRNERQILGAVSRLSESRPFHGSLMADDWERPSPATAQVTTLALLFDIDAGDVDTSNPQAVTSFIEACGATIGWRTGSRTPPRTGAPGRRLLNRQRRALEHATAKVTRMERVELRRHFAHVGRIGLAGTITAEAFDADVNVAAYVSYVAAKANTRREFTLDGRANNVDQVAAMLRRRLDANPDTNWSAVARITATPDVLARLDAVELGELLGIWFSEMRVAADLLGGLHAAAPVDRSTMIVSTGHDSDTWNLAAGAYNRARSAWISTLAATGALAVLDEFCPPKAMKLMAGDLIWMHVASGGQASHPDVVAAALLPEPWTVIAGDSPCTAGDIEAACVTAELDPAATGWTAPHGPRAVGEFTPTPELVHGITIGDPLFAAILRRGKVFSGKSHTADVADVLDRLVDEGYGQHLR